MLTAINNIGWPCQFSLGVQSFSWHEDYEDEDCEDCDQDVTGPEGNSNYDENHEKPSRMTKGRRQAFRFGAALAVVGVLICFSIVLTSPVGEPDKRGLDTILFLGVFLFLIGLAILAFSLPHPETKFDLAGFPGET